MKLVSEQSREDNPIYHKIDRGCPTYKCDLYFKLDINDLEVIFGFKSWMGDLDE